MGFIYLIRHGQASFTQENYDQLTPLGINQSCKLGQSLKSRVANISKVYSGTLQRHLDTAKYCLNEMNIQLPIEQMSFWNEYDHMELIRQHNPLLKDHDTLKKWVITQSNPMSAIQEVLNASINDWMQNKKEYTISWRIFSDQIINGLMGLKESLKKSENALVFTSGGPITVACLHLLQLKTHQFIELQGRLVNTGLTKLLIGAEKIALSTLNEHGHLEHDKSLITYR